MVLNDYQKKLIAEGFYARLMNESSPDKRVLLVLEFMEAMIPKDLPSTIPVIRDGTKFEGPKNNLPITSLIMDDVPSARG